MSQQLSEFGNPILNLDRDLNPVAANICIIDNGISHLNQEVGVINSDDYDLSDDSNASDLSQVTIDDESAITIPARTCRLKSGRKRAVSFLSHKVNAIIKYRHLAEIIRSHPKKPDIQFQQMMKECQNYFRFKLNPEQENVIKRQITIMKNQHNDKWKKWNRHQQRFDQKEEQWLDNYLTVPESWFEFPNSTATQKSKRLKKDRLASSTKQPTKVPGQSKNFDKLSKRGQEKAVQKVTQKMDALPTRVILRSTKQVLSKRNEKATSAILKGIANGSINPDIVLQKIRKPEVVPRAFSDDEALAVLLLLKLSQFSYKFLRNQCVDRQIKLFSSYHKLSASKIRCHPDNVAIKETIATVPLQDLLNHTGSRIIQSQEDVIFGHLNPIPLSYTLFCVYGFDGSSSQARYSQKFSDTDRTTEENIFATTMTPMRLTTTCGQLIWQNPMPQSIRYCRPIKLEYVRETTITIQNERDNLAHEISALSVCTTPLRDHELKVTFDLRLTVIDGKALQAITEVTKSSQACPLCGSNPSAYNVIDNLTNGKFKAKMGTLVHGVSPLHCWIRLLEFCLKLGYRKPAEVYPVRQKCHKELYEMRKKIIQKNFRDSLGILVDVVKQGEGITNTGNVARKAFQNYEVFAGILDIDLEFVRRLYIILVAISCQFEVDSIKFGQFCKETFKYYVSIYPWHPMSVTLHKILVHAEAIIENSILPLGLMSENGAESRNKYWRHDREFHARQMNREVNLSDIFHRAFESSDPVISSYFEQIRKNQRQRLPLPSEVLNMLQIPVPPTKFDSIPPIEEFHNIDTDNEENGDPLKWVSMIYA